MSAKKSWLAVVVGASLVLNGCAGMLAGRSKTQNALIAAAACGIPGGLAGGFVSHNNNPNTHIPVGAGAAIGIATGALLCGGLAYFLTPEPPPPPPPPPPAPKAERTIILDDVLFDFDKSTLKPATTQILDRLVAFMIENKDKSANLAGYTDNVGTEAYNQALSERRVNSVKSYVVGKGVDSGRVSGQGFGESKPIADNKTAEGRAKNRRVEIKVN